MCDGELSGDDDPITGESHGNRKLEVIGLILHREGRGHEDVRQFSGPTGRTHTHGAVRAAVQQLPSEHVPARTASVLIGYIACKFLPFLGAPRLVVDFETFDRERQLRARFAANFSDRDVALDIARRYDVAVAQSLEQAGRIDKYPQLARTPVDLVDARNRKVERIRVYREEQQRDGSQRRQATSLTDTLRAGQQPPREPEMTDRVRVEIENHIAEVTLNRPEKHNAVDLAMFEALTEAGDALKKDSSVRAVVLHGGGENFCAGIDFAVFKDGGLEGIDESGFRPRDGSPANLFQSAAYVWRELPVPVIAAIAGVAFGAGLQIAMGADIRFANPSARFSIMEIKWGIIPDMAITATLRDIVAIDKIKELALSGRIIGGDEAERIGLVTALHDDPVSVARSFAAEIADKSPDAIRAIKQLVDMSWQIPIEDSLKLEAELQMKTIGTTNQIEAVMANLEGRDPNFD
jgi:enoyl-CoA hydratase/carnithine racemase